MIRIVLLVISSFLLFACTQITKPKNKSTVENTLKNDLLSSQVVVKNYINITSNNNPDWVKTAVDNKLIKTILDIALKGNVTVYTTDQGDTIPLTINEINSNLGQFTDSVQIETALNTYIDTVITTPAKTEQVEGLFFKENWSFNADNFTFTKQITEYLPVREYYKTLEDGSIDSSRKVKSLVYKIINNNNSKKFEKVAENIITPFYFNAETPNQINGLDVLKFSDYILNYAYKNKKDVYDINEGTKLTYNEVEYALGAGIDTVQMEIKPGSFEDVVLEYEPDVSEIIGVVFVENWYIDKETLSFKKEVIGLAPIRRFTDIDPAGDNYEKTTIPYLIKL